MPPDSEGTGAVRERPSTALSWAMLGFLFGALAILAWQRRTGEPPAERPSPPARAEAMPNAVVAAAPRLLTTVEAVFADWGDRASWTGNLTEVALWNPATGAFSDFYEVRRASGQLYFRSLPALTRRIIRRGREEPSCPLLFTETEAEYQEWLRHGRTERPPP